MIGMAGRSRGAELALLLGSRFSAIRSVVAYCPSSIVWNGLRGSTPVDLSAWRESDRPVPFLSLMGPGLADLRSRVLRAAPIQVIERLEAHGHPFRSRHCRYPGAGHLMRSPGVSTSILRNTFAFDGYGPAQAAANCAAWAERSHSFGRVWAFTRGPTRLQ